MVWIEGFFFLFAAKNILPNNEYYHRNAGELLGPERSAWPNIVKRISKIKTKKGLEKQYIEINERNICLLCLKVCL